MTDSEYPFIYRPYRNPAMRLATMPAGAGQAAHARSGASDCRAADRLLDQVVLPETPAGDRPPPG
ncbi:MAG: hypothetical protein C0504_14850 [Candidatus Solibacter sp.]|nr:hypothetical protein [Candidatus Solibacter sp.]